MTPQLIVDYSSLLAIAILVLALFGTVYRVVVGPTLPDRIIALDMLVGIVIGFIAVIALRTGYTLYIDIAIALGLVGFLATVAFARFILARGRVGEGEGESDSATTRPLKPRSPKGNKPAKPSKSAGAAGAREAK